MTSMLKSAAVLCALASPAIGQQVNECDWRASAWNLLEPWEQNSKTFANGNVRISLIDTVEPAAGAFHILVLSPPYDEIGARQCRVLSFDGSLGFARVFFDELDASYDPAQGLIFTVPIVLYMPEHDFQNSGVFGFILNQATGEIETAMDLAE